MPAAKRRQDQASDEPGQDHGNQDDFKKIVDGFLIDPSIALVAPQDFPAMLQLALHRVQLAPILRAQKLGYVGLESLEQYAAVILGIERRIGWAVIAAVETGHGSAGINERYAPEPYR